MFMRLLRALTRRRDGSVSVISAVSLPFLIAMVGMVAEYGNGLLHKIEDQRIADAAAFAAATAYNANPSNSMTSAVDAVASLNGITTSDIAENVVNSPSGDGNQAVQVTVTTQVPLLLSRVLGNTSTQLTVTATSFAEMKGGAPGCIIALSGAGAGVPLSGGTSVTASACAVASNASVAVPCGTSITTIVVDYDTSAPSEPCTGIVAPTGKTLGIHKTLTVDPLVGTSPVTTATGRIATVAALTSPASPTVATGGSNVNFAYSALSGLPSGCVATQGEPNYIITCTGAGPFNFGNLTFGGGISVTFVSSASAVFNINGSINFTGSNLHFGQGTYNIKQGLITGGGTTTTFGAGTFNIGASSASCNGSTGYSICNTGTILCIGCTTTISGTTYTGGTSVFTLQGGIYNSGGETLLMGAGTNNSFDIGKANDGNSFAAGGGATTYFGDATGTGDVFEMAGNFNISSGGGSCTEISAASEHDINGFLGSAGGLSLGSGVYTVNGYIGLGNNGGGNVTCWGSTLGVSGINVTLVTSAASTMSGNCSGQAFCVEAGYGSVTLTAPTSGPTANLVVVGPTNGNTAGASFGEGSSGTSLSGAFYFPTGALTLSGAASVGNGVGQCLMFIGSQVSLVGGSTLASSCSGLGGTSSGSTVVLVG